MVFAEGTKSVAYPHVTYGADAGLFDARTVFRVHVDGIEITQCSNVVKALTIAFIQHWIFNVQYPKPYFGTLALFDTIIFRKNSIRAPSKVINLSNKLC